MKSYPYIGKGQDNRVVLFFKPECGTVLEDGGLIYNKGDYSDAWIDRMFENITADYLRDTKIKIESPEHLEMIKLMVDRCGSRLSDVSTADNEIVICFGDNQTPISEIKEIFLPLPTMSEVNIEATMPDVKPSKEVAAVKTLEGLNYTYHGAELWRPPLGKCPKHIANHPIYTREMHERGELPPVGSEVIVSFDSKPSIVVSSEPDDNGMIVTKFDGEYLITCIDVVKPLPTPADELRDKLVESMDNSNTAFTYAEHIAKSIINGDIDLSKYVGCGYE